VEIRKHKPLFLEKIFYEQAFHFWLPDIFHIVMQRKQQQSKTYEQ